MKLWNFWTFCKNVQNLILPKHFSTPITIISYMLVLNFNMSGQCRRRRIIFSTVFALQHFKIFHSVIFLQFFTQMQSFHVIFHIPTVVKGFSTVWTQIWFYLFVESIHMSKIGVLLKCANHKKSQDSMLRKPSWN